MSALGSIYSVLGLRDSTPSEIAAFSGFCTDHIARELKRLRLEGVVHVAAWRRTGFGPIAPVYRLAPGPDAPRPDPLPRKSRAKPDHLLKRKRKAAPTTTTTTASPATAKYAYD